MQKLFNRILVPFDYSGRSLELTEKALALAIRFQCDLHLLHSAGRAPELADQSMEWNRPLPYSSPAQPADQNTPLEQLLTSLQERLGKKSRLNCSAAQGKLEHALATFAGNQGIDLILIFGGDKKKMDETAGSIVARHHIPVLMLPPNQDLRPLQLIVIPVTDFLPVRKLVYGIYMASAYPGCRIKLVGIEQRDNHDKVQHYLEKAYRLIRENCELKTELETMRGKRTPALIWEYAQAQAADLVILHPSFEQRSGNFLPHLLETFVAKEPEPAVLMINPV